MRRRRQRIPRRRLGGVTLLGLLYAGQSAAYFASLRSVPAAVTSILLYTYPVIVILLARLLLGERLSGRRLAALAVACLGTLLVVDPLGAAHLDGAGVLLGLASAGVYSAYILCGSVFLRGLDAVAAMAGISAVAALAYLVAGASTGQLATPSATGWLVILGAAVLATAVAATAFLAGLARIGPGRAVIVSTLEPVSTAVLAALLLGEGLSTRRWAGAALVLLAAATLGRPAAASVAERPLASPAR